MSRKLNRRRFLEQLGGVTATTLAAGVVGAPSLTRLTVADANAAEMGPDDVHDRRWQAYKLRHEAAMAHSNQPFPSFPTNGDEEAYPSKIASYTKGLPHNERGEVNLTAYDALLKALATGQHAAFEAIPMGGKLKFANPQAAYAFALEGPDPHQVAMPAPPAFSSAEMASEMIELYWQALTRDVPFVEYDSHALTNVAAADLSKCSDSLTWIMLVGIAFVGMGEVLSQLLFSYEKFFLPGLAASGANLVVGLGILSLGHTYGVYGLVLLVIAASACQFTLQLVFLKEKIRFYAPKIDFRHSQMAELSRLSAPLLLSVGGTQLAMMTDRIFASLLPVGNLSALMYAVRLFRVPTDFLTDALQQATFPHFARLSAEQDFPIFSRHLFRYLRFVLSLTVPAAVGIVILADLIVSVVYQRGAFDETSAHLTTQALMAYALGLPAISLMKILNRTFFSLKNTQTPTVMTIARMVMKAVLCWVLIQPLAHVGIALAESLSQSLRVLLLFFFLPNHVKGTHGREMLLSSVYILAASLLMGSGIYYLKQSVDGLIDPLLELVLLIFVGAILYLASIIMVQKEELLAFLKQLRASSSATS